MYLKINIHFWQKNTQECSDFCYFPNKIKIYILALKSVFCLMKDIRDIYINITNWARMTTISFFIEHKNVIHFLVNLHIENNLN